MTAVKELRDKITKIISEYGLSVADVFADKEKESIPTEETTERILALLEKCPAMTIEDCPWGKKNVEFRKIFLRGMNRPLEGIEVEEECPNKNKHWTYNPMYPYGDTEVPCSKCGYTGQHSSSEKYTRPATLQDIDLKDLINHYDYPCGKDHVPKTPTGGKLVVKH